MQRSSPPPCVPRPASSPPPARWRAFVCRPSGRPASTKHTSATAARRSPVPCARRPRSRLGSPARLSRSGGRLRFRQASSPPVQVRRFAATFPVSPQPAFIHARSTALPNCFCPFLRRQPARLRSSPIRITLLLFINPTNCKNQQPPHPKLRAAVAAGERSNLCFPVERPAAGSAKKIIAVAPAALGIHSGSQVFRRQPSRLRPSPNRITPRRSLFPKTAARSRHRA